MKARFLLSWHCFWHLWKTLCTLDPKTHREVIATHTVVIRGTRLPIFWKYSYLGCTCGKEFHRSEHLEVWQEIIIRKWNWK